MDKTQFKKWSEWTNLLRNLFTIVASVVSVATLYLLIRQNENTYRPDVDFSPGNTLVNISYKENPLLCEDISMKSANDSTNRDLYLIATNLGLGAAKKIQLEWAFDANQFDDTLTLAGTNIPTNVHYEKGDGALLFKNCMFQEPLEGDADFSLPAHLGKEPTRFMLPQNYLRLWANLLINIFHSPQIAPSKSSELLLECVKQKQVLRLKATYFDINQKKYTRFYILQVIPRYINAEQKQIILALRMKETKQKTATQKHLISVYFSDRSFRSIPVDL